MSATADTCHLCKTSAPGEAKPHIIQTNLAFVKEYREIYFLQSGDNGGEFMLYPCPVAGLAEATTINSQLTRELRPY